MDMNIETLKHLVDYGVIALLIFMSFIAVWFFVERVIFFKKVNIKNYKNKKQLDVALTKHLTIIGHLQKVPVLLHAAHPQLPPANDPTRHHLP